MRFVVAAMWSWGIFEGALLCITICVEKHLGSLVYVGMKSEKTRAPGTRSDTRHRGGLCQTLLSPNLEARPFRRMR